MVASSSLKLQLSSLSLRCNVLSLMFNFLAICDSEGVPLGNRATDKPRVMQDMLQEWARYEKENGLVYADSSPI